VREAEKRHRHESCARSSGSASDCTELAQSHLTPGRAHSRPGPAAATPAADRYPPGCNTNEKYALASPMIRIPRMISQFDL
jgi:hypothetical protein